MTLRYCRGVAHATSRRVALHHPASGTLLLYKQRRSQCFVTWEPLEHLSHFEARSADVLALTSLRRGQRRHLEACSTGGSARSPARHEDLQHWWTSHGTVTRITGGSLHGTESGTRHGTRSSSVRHSLRSWTL